MAAYDGSVLSYGVETDGSPGSLGANTPMIIIPARSADINAIRNFGNAEEARDDFFDTEDDEISRDADFSLERIFRPGVFDHFLEMALFSRFTRFAYRENGWGGATAEISAVTGSSSTYTVTNPAAGDRKDFAPSLLVLASGFTNPANNGLKLATTGSNATTLIVTGAGSTLEDETPPRGAKLEVVGSFHVATDISISGDDLISDAEFDFAAHGLAAGCWVKPGGAAALNRFDTALNNDAVRIGEIPAAGTLTMDLKPTGWANDAGTDQALYIFWAEPMKPANLPKTVRWQTAVRRKADFKRKQLFGSYLETLTLGTTARDYCTLNAAFKGLDFQEDLADLNTRANGPSRELSLAPPMRAGYECQRVYVDGAFSTRNIAMRNSSFEFAPTLVPIDAEGYPGYESFDRSFQSVRLTGEAHFQTDVLYGKYQAGTKFNFVRIMNTPAGGAYVFDMARSQAVEGKETTPGRGQPVTLSFAIKATADDAGIAAGKFNNFYAKHRFRYADGWPDLTAFTA